MKVAEPEIPARARAPERDEVHAEERERDTPGHLPPHDGAERAPPRTPPPASSANGPADAKPDGLELGVAKNVPDDPSGGADRVLSAGYQLARKLAPAKR